MTKEKILNIYFSEMPDVRIRVIDDLDSVTMKKNKIKYPFELYNSVNVTIETTRRTFTFPIYSGYTWNGADIPVLFYRIIGPRTSNQFLIASMLHDYLLEFKTYIMREILKDTVSMKEYRRLTSLVFREKIKSDGTNVIKANIMAWFVDIFQICNRRSWRCQ